jgi:hypothetical protein
MRNLAYNVAAKEAKADGKARHQEIGHEEGLEVRQSPYRLPPVRRGYSKYVGATQESR